MYRVMIVDDEPLILAGITSMLDWEEHQCKIVGKASNGQKALAQMEAIQPDIVITDIKMPSMDGISFMRAAVEKGYRACFILLTNLEEFPLVREAMHLGAVDYLVKLELHEEDLIQSLTKAKERCDFNHRMTKESDRAELTVDERIQNYFRRILVYDTDKQPDDMLSEVIRKRFSVPILVLINFNYGYEGFSEAFTRADQKKVMGFAEDIINGMIKGFFDNSCLLRREQNGFILVLPLSGIEDYKEQIRIMSLKFRNVVKDYFEVPIFIAASLPGKGVEEIQDLLYQAMCAMNYTYYDSSSTIIFYSEKCEENLNHSSNFNINFLKSSLTSVIRQNDCQRFSEIMDQIIKLFSECRPSRPQAVNACNNLYYFITFLMEERNDQNFPYAVDIVGQLNRMADLSTVLVWLEGFRGQVVKALELQKECRKDKNIELAQEYIREHFKEKITLSQVAAALNISQGHLSSTFKKQTGKKFSDYVTEVKIEKAKELIVTYQYMMYEISDMLGFDTQYYFSSVFKKITGYTPKEYENMTVRKHST